MTESTGRRQNGLSRIGVTGLAVMGANLARNIARRGVPIAVHNRTTGADDGVHGGVRPTRATFTGGRDDSRTSSPRWSARAGSS